MYVFLIVPHDLKLPIRTGHYVVGGIREGDAGKHDRHEAWAKVRAKIFDKIGRDFGRIYSVAEWEVSEGVEIQRFHKVYAIAKEADFHIRTLRIRDKRPIARSSKRRDAIMQCPRCGNTETDELQHSDWYCQQGTTCWNIRALKCGAEHKAQAARELKDAWNKKYTDAEDRMTFNSAAYLIAAAVNDDMPRSVE